MAIRQFRDRALKNSSFPDDQFGFYLKSSDGGALEPEVSLEILGDLPNQTLEGQLTDEELGGLLVPPDLSEGDCTGPVSVGLLNSSGGRSRFSGCLRGQLFPGGLASSRFTSSLLGTGHGSTEKKLCLIL